MPPPSEPIPRAVMSRYGFELQDDPAKPHQQLYKAPPQYACTACLNRSKACVIHIMHHNSDNHTITRFACVNCERRHDKCDKATYRSDFDLLYDKATGRLQPVPKPAGRVKDAQRGKFNRERKRTGSDEELGVKRKFESQNDEGPRKKVQEQQPPSKSPTAQTATSPDDRLPSMSRSQTPPVSAASSSPRQPTRTPALAPFRGMAHPLHLPRSATPGGTLRSAPSTRSPTPVSEALCPAPVITNASNSDSLSPRDERRDSTVFHTTGPRESSSHEGVDLSISQTVAIPQLPRLAPALQSTHAGHSSTRTEKRHSISMSPKNGTSTPPVPTQGVPRPARTAQRHSTISVSSPRPIRPRPMRVVDLVHAQPAGDRSISSGGRAPVYLERDSGPSDSHDVHDRHESRTRPSSSVGLVAPIVSAAERIAPLHMASPRIGGGEHPSVGRKGYDTSSVRSHPQSPSHRPRDLGDNLQPVSNTLTALLTVLHDDLPSLLSTQPSPALAGIHTAIIRDRQAAAAAIAAAMERMAACDRVAGMLERELRHRVE